MKTHASLAELCPAHLADVGFFQNRGYYQFTNGSPPTTDELTNRVGTRRLPARLLPAAAQAGIPQMIAAVVSDGFVQDSPYDSNDDH